MAVVDLNTKESKMIGVKEKNTTTVPLSWRIVMATPFLYCHDCIVHAVIYFWVTEINVGKMERLS